MIKFFLLLFGGLLLANNLAAFEGEVSWEPGFGVFWHPYTFAVADINGDQQNELIFANSSGYIYITRYDGNTLTTLWRSQNFKYPPYKIQIKDLDDDGIPEIIGGGGTFEMGGYFIIKHVISNQYELLFQNEDFPTIYSAFAADLDNDGQWEMAGSGSGTVSVYEELEGELVVVTQHDSLFLYGIGYFDGEANPLLLCRGYNYNNGNKLGFWNYSGQSLQEVWSGWMGSPTAGSDQRYGIGDLNGDGDDELVVLNGTGGGDMDNIQGLYVWDYNPEDQSFIQLWSTWTDVYQDNALVDIGDTDGDGQAEIVVWVRSIHAGMNENIYIFEYQDGNFELIHESPPVPREIVFGETMTVGDVDNDGFDEIVIGDLEGMMIYGFDNITGEYGVNCLSPTPFIFTHGHGIDDFDRDGFQEIGLVEYFKKGISLWSFQDDDYDLKWRGNYIEDSYYSGLSNRIMNVRFNTLSDPKVLISNGAYLTIGTIGDTTFISEWFDPEYDGIGACFYDVGQMDDDPDEEIVASNWYTEDLYSMDYNREMNDYTITLVDDGVEFSESAHPALLDLDGDGLDEIVVAASNSTLRVFKKQGNDYLLWFVHPLIYGNIWTAIDKADLDQDGDEELIYGGVYNNSYAGRLQALDFDPDQIRLVTFHDFGDPPDFINGCKVGELGPAHRKVLVVATSKFPDRMIESNVFVHDLTTFELLWQSENLGRAAGYLNSISIGDADSDGENELLVSTDYYLHLLEFTDPVGIEEPVSAEIIRLSQSYPNPIISGQATAINFELPAPAQVSVSIYNAAGQRVQSLLDDRRAAGSYQITWDGRNETGQPVGSGVYFYRLQAVSAGMEQVIQTRKMVVIR